MRKNGEKTGYSIGKIGALFVLVATFEGGLFAVLTGKSRSAVIKELEQRYPHDQVVEGAYEAEAALAEIIKLAKNPQHALDVPLFFRATDFQKKVWQAVMAVPYGQEVTYGEIARRIDRPRAMRAVGSACKNCPLMYVVPCHRIKPSSQVSIMQRSVGHINRQRKAAAEKRR